MKRDTSQECNRLKILKHMIILINTEKMDVDKIQRPVNIYNTQKTRNTRELPHPDQGYL